MGLIREGGSSGFSIREKPRREGKFQLCVLILIILDGYAPTLVDQPPGLVFWKVKDRSGLEDFPGIFDSSRDENVQFLAPS